MLRGRDEDACGNALTRATLTIMARALVALLCCLSALTARADAAGGQRARARGDVALRAADRALARGKPALALRALERALASSSEARIALAYGKLALPFDGVYGASALPPLTRRAEVLSAAIDRVDAVESEPETLRLVRLYAAFARVLAGRDEEGIALVFAAGRLQDPTTVLALRAIAAVHVHREQLSLAERALGLARQYVLQDLVVMAELGRVRLARGDSAGAVVVLGERFGIEPLSLAARRDYAYALVAAGRASEALSLLDAVAGTCSALPGCALEAARTALEADRPERALAFARSCLRARPDDLDALFLLADAHMRSGELAAARTAYADVLRSHPESVRAKQALEELARSNEAGR